MAGAGYKLFNTGDVLTAAQVNTYLQEQVVMVFANAAARTTALSGVLAEGMVSYLKDTDALEIYSGAAWVGYGSGDITGVTAGTGISGGGTSGTVTITNSMATEITAAGDIIVGTGSGTFDNLPIGTTGQVLTADTTVSPYKVKWATASSGGITKLSTTTLTGTGTQAITGISTDYKNLMVVMYQITNLTANSYRYVRPNGTSGIASYFQTNAATTVASDSVDSIYLMPVSYYSAYNNTANIAVLTIYDYANASCHKAWSIQGHVNDGTVYRPFIGGGGISTNNAITSLTFVQSSYNFNGGTVEIYGVK